MLKCLAICIVCLCELKREKCEVDNTKRLKYIQRVLRSIEPLSSLFFVGERRENHQTNRLTKHTHTHTSAHGSRLVVSVFISGESIRSHYSDFDRGLTLFFKQKIKLLCFGKTFRMIFPNNNFFWGGGKAT